MFFIFPKNYFFKQKLFGIFDYSTIILNITIYALCLVVLYLIPFTVSIKIFIFIIICFPITLISIFGINGENLLYIFKYIFSFLLKPKVYLYRKIL